MERVLVMSEKLDRVVILSDTTPKGLADAVNRIITRLQGGQAPVEVVSVSYQALSALSLSQAGTPEYSALLHLRGERFPDDI
jgi:chromosomal replication initiation ATPase DnaA